MSDKRLAINESQQHLLIAKIVIYYELLLQKSVIKNIYLTTIHCNSTFFWIILSLSLHIQQNKFKNQTVK